MARDPLRKRRPTAWPRSTGSAKPRSPHTPGSVLRWRHTGSPWTRTPGRSMSSDRTQVRSAPGPPRSPATSTGTRPRGVTSIPTRSPVRGCGSRGTAEPGQRPALSGQGGVPASGAELVARLERRTRGPSATATRRAHGPGGVEPRSGRSIATPPRSLGGKSRVGAKRSSWNQADLQGSVDNSWRRPGSTLYHHRCSPTELAEDITARAADLCKPLLPRDDVPEHIRATPTSPGAVLGGRARPHHPAPRRAPRSPLGPGAGQPL